MDVRHIVLATVAGLVLVASVGCTSGSSTGGSSPAVEPTAGSPSLPTATVAPTPSSTSTHSSRATNAASEPTATVARTSVAGPLGGRARFEVYQLRRSGHLVVLEFGVRGLDGRPFAKPHALSWHHKKADVSGVYLYDRSHRLKYWPARSDGQCVCSTGIEPVSGTRVALFSATYAAPPTSVHHIEVNFAKLATLRTVPIEG